MSKCHIVGNRRHWLNFVWFCYVDKVICISYQWFMTKDMIYIEDLTFVLMFYEFIKRVGEKR